MKLLLLKVFIVLLLFIFSIDIKAQTENANYNKVLADSLDADKYGMKMYVLVLLKTGAGKAANKVVADSLFRGHMQNMGRLVEIGKLIIAGPLEANTKNYEGIFVLNVKTIAEATALLDTDPAVKAKLLDPELYQWYGSAALPLYLKYHNVVKKIKF